LPNVQLVAVIDASGDDRLTGPDQLNTWQVLATNAGKLDDQLSFFGFENLTGGAAKDTFTISSGAGLTGKLDGGSGQNDSLDYHPWNQPVSFDLANLKATGLGAIAGLERFAGGSASDTLTGPNAPNFWSIKAVNSGAINTLFFGVLSFDSVENLTGGTSSDVFQFAMPGQLTGSVNGGTGTDQLDYSLLPITMPVRVNLLAGTSTRVGDTIAAIENAAGSAGDDILVGNALPNTLTGNGGRDLIIGGLGSDILSGGTGEDLLIGGKTLYDLDVTALTAIMAEWTSNQAYTNRRLHLLGQAGGLNGIYSLNNNVVQDDFANDAITGAGEMDWFWANPNEIMDLVAGEHIGIN
jgi:Ca2+-binding RTX toxin-like protein